MKRTPSILVAALLGLTACTDQPTPMEPEPTATVTETVTATPAEDLVPPERVAASIKNVLDGPTLEEIRVGDAAIAALEDHITLSDEEHGCTITGEVVPEVTAFGTIAGEEDEAATSRGLAALGFRTADDAAVYTDHLRTVLQECEAASYEIVPLTHHTDEAIEIQVESDDEPAASVVLLRNDYWVLVAVSTPPADVALSLTQVDQLDEMLR